MSLVTITVTATLAQFTLPPLVPSPDGVNLTVPAPVRISSTAVDISDLALSETLDAILSSTLGSTLVSSSSNTIQPQPSPSAASIDKSLESSSPTLPSLAQDSSTGPGMASPETGPNPKQIAAIVASVVSATVFLIAFSIAMRCYVVRKRQYYAEQQRQRNLGKSLGSTASQAERGDIGEGRVSAADTHRSSIWGDWGEATRSVVPASTLSGDVLDSRLWPLPPGHSERYTFFSERSSITVDDTLETERWSVGSRDESEIRDDDLARAESRSSDSVWGIPGAGTVN
ncbi:hypothetical protein F4677DRAFT_284961 [Hypoxylon crocopeplum]|nr:hypothetical protein F4677DRAFT_284961 [Hypoxylon crocopeplum]